MNKRSLNDALKRFRFDPKNDPLVRLLSDVTNDGYYINRAVQLLREAEFLNNTMTKDNAEARIDECIKLLIIRKCVHADSARNNGKVKPSKARRVRQVEREP